MKSIKNFMQMNSRKIMTVMLLLSITIIPDSFMGKTNAFDLEQHHETLVVNAILGEVERSIDNFKVKSNDAMAPTTVYRNKPMYMHSIEFGMGPSVRIRFINMVSFFVVPSVILGWTRYLPPGYVEYTGISN